MPKSRSPVLGYNHNIRHKGRVFHVQTEDSGITSPHIFTHLFHEGVIIASKKLEYDREADNDIVKGLMQAQHKSVMKELRGGVFDAKIDAYLGPVTEETEAIPQDVEDAAATIPTPPHEAPEPEMEADDAISSPYVQMVIGDESQAAVSGEFMTVAAAEPDDTDDEINGLLSRLREDTPRPDPAPTPVHGESPGTWIVARPGQKERPFERSGPVPLPVRDEVARRVLTPPQVPSTQPPSQRRSSTGRSLTPPAVVPPRTMSQPLTPVSPHRPTPPPTRPPPPPARTSTATTPVLPRSHSGSAVPTPVLPRGPAGGPPGRRDGVTAPLRSGSGVSPFSREQVLPPITRPAPRVPTRPPTTPPSRLSPSVTVTPRRPTQESVVVARPAVVIGAPPTVIGGPNDQGQRRAHGREPTLTSTPTDSIFGQDLISEKSLDEVIMAYLSEESNDD